MRLTKKHALELEAQIERIICAACWYRDVEFNIDKDFKEQYLPVNCDKGIVLSGYRHLQCQRQMNYITGLRACEVDEVQGFLTSKNRFVGRKEAAQIAEKAGQLLYWTDYLFSEDLY